MLSLPPIFTNIMLATHYGFKNNVQYWHTHLLILASCQVLMLNPIPVFKAFSISKCLPKDFAMLSSNCLAKFQPSDYAKLWHRTQAKPPHSPHALYYGSASEELDKNCGVMVMVHR